MGEIMRWRVTRAPQRRIPSTESVVQLATVELSADQQAAINAGSAGSPQAISELQTLVAPYAMGQYLGGVGTPILRGLWLFDDWLASKGNAPGIAELGTNVTALLGPFLPITSPAWRSLSGQLANALYQILLANASGNYSGHFSTETSALITRWLLVVQLVDTLESAAATIQTPNDVYAALRWRTLVLPDLVEQALLKIRASHSAIVVRKPGFADLYITREEWDHYEAAEIASIENILPSELKSRVHILVNQTQVTTKH